MPKRRSISPKICRNKKAKLIHFSTDYVFDARSAEPYVETDAAKPISIYGESKRQGRKCLGSTRSTSGRPRLVGFRPDRPEFYRCDDQTRARRRTNRRVRRQIFHAPLTRATSQRMLPHFSRDPGGVLHFANSGQCSWQEYAQHALNCCRQVRRSLKAKNRQTSEDRRHEELDRAAVRFTQCFPRAEICQDHRPTPRSWRDAVSDYIERSYSKK